MLAMIYLNENLPPGSEWFVKISNSDELNVKTSCWIIYMDLLNEEVRWVRALNERFSVNFMT